MATTEALAELQKLRETTESLRRIARNLPSELGNEINRVARAIEDDADALERVIGSGC